MKLRAGNREWEFPRAALVMGVVNATPDSFYDGGWHGGVEAAIAHGLKLAGEGAEILDVGGESTRPDAAPVEEAEELRRVLPVVRELAARSGRAVSIDTRKPAVARAAIEAGACLVNDIEANRADDAMGRLIAESGAGYVAMHMQGTPQTMQIRPEYDDVRAEVKLFFVERLERLAGLGVRAEQMVLDVGIGFGKTTEHNLQLLAGISRFTRFQRPLLLGVSRKSFIGRLLGVEAGDRLPASLACACWGVEAGLQIIRAHDVLETVQALRMTEAILKRRG